MAEKAEHERQQAIVCVDMDGVVVEFTSAFPLLSEQLLEEYAGRLDEIPSIFALMTPIPGALEAVRQLQETGYEVYLLSTAPWKNPTAWVTKLEWVHKHTLARPCTNV